MGRAHGRHREPAAVPSRRRPRFEPSRDAGQPRRLHPLQPLRAGLPRGAGQRRHRHGLAGRRLEDRLRLRRRDGREHLRRLRGVRAGVPDRRADGGVAGRRSRRRPQAPARRGRQRVPLLRSRVPDHLPAQRTTPRARPGTRPGARPAGQGRGHGRRQGQDQGHRRGAGPRRSRQPQPPVREGAVRLRLRDPSPSPRHTARPARRRAEVGRLRGRPREPLHPLPRGELGGGARSRGGRARRDSRPRRRRRARRLRLREGLERGGVPRPEAGPPGLRHQQRGSLHAPVSCVVGGRVCSRASAPGR